jgi:hypothetical protein
MRALGVIAAFGGVIVIGLLALTNTVFAPAPAAERLSGVTVQWVDFHIEDLDEDGRHRLRLTVRIHGDRAIDECVGFALDEPFAGRRLEPASGACPRPVAGDQDVELTFDRLTDSDVSFTSHTIVWGIPGGRCGILLEAVGVCVIDQAGTVPLEFPRPPGQPTFPPLGSFPLGSFFPFFSFEPIP